MRQPVPVANEAALPRDSRASGYLDLARAAAAAAVLLLHAKVTLLPAYSALPRHNALTTGLYLLCTRGYQGVMVFFVLSGYLIGSHVLRNIASGRWSWRRYLIERLTRLWVVLLPALLLTAGWNAAAAVLFHAPSVNGDPRTFFANLFFLQGIAAPVYGGDGPLWSLSYEFWFYLLFPCLALCVTSKTLSQRVAYGVAFLALALFVGRSICLYFVIWLAGTLPVILPRPWQFVSRRLGPKLALAASLAVFLAVTAARKDASTIRFSYDVVVGFTFAVVLYVVVLGYRSMWPSHTYGWRRLVAFAAGFSYTVYLVHYPVFHFVSAWLGTSRSGPSGIDLTLLAAVPTATVVYAWLVSLVTEAHTGRIRTLLFARLIPPALSMSEVPPTIPNVANAGPT